ncbi:unnamed protein product [Effrenium voratum]|uniref:Uncharacterized protein n=1 Tax=Effrenium voratum TaxID=2562239 RepID=A0AA36IAD0_9DINO|nr:unnamed protein product [Effrenium voratum]CAJ1419129.1 unnamed protein product [Effrenium voratum]
MPPAYELAELDDSESGSESSSQVDVDCMADLFQVCCGVFCCLWILFITVGSEVVAWNRQASCSGKEGDGRIQWNAVLPPETATAMRLGIPSLLWHQVDVFNGSTADGQKLGYWSNVDLFLGNVQKYAYVVDGEGALLEGWRPWGVYLGSRYHLWLCSSLVREYAIEEDWWGRPWWSFGTDKIFNIIERPSGKLVAKSQHKVQDMWSLKAYWTASLESPAGTAIATLRQETPVINWFFYGTQKWLMANQRPDLLPNEVVSFLAAVYDIDKVRDTND